jgi:hypothetical protein
MDAAKVELLRALGKVVRGLSALFWALPVTLVLAAATARTDWLGFLDDAAFVPAMIGSMVLFQGVRQLRDFQKQERIWQQALTRAEFFAMIDIGLAPFLYWWRRFPNLVFYTICILVLTFSTLLFLMQINHVLRRLCAMLPDEALRVETNMFTTLNIGLFLFVFVAVAIGLALHRVNLLPDIVVRLLSGSDPQGLWLILFLTLFPLALTLAILWKIKEVIFQSIFEAEP